MECLLSENGANPNQMFKEKFTNTHNSELPIYFLQSVTEKCATFICEHLLDVDNALSLRTIFLSVGCRFAAEEVDRFIEKNFALVSHSDKFLELSTEDLVELLSKDKLNVVSEEEVFNAAIRVLSCVRLHLLDKRFLVDKVARYPPILHSSQCREMVDEVKNFYLVPGREPKSPLHLRPRRRRVAHWTIFLK
ncbi:BTB And Kelch, partial [Ancylostoma duodenale]